jgi:hypothetical protein
MTKIVVQGATRGRTDRQRVSWALSFAQSKLRGWQDADWLEAFRDALDFAAADGQEAAHADLPLLGFASEMGLTSGKPAPTAKQAQALLRPAHRALYRFVTELEKAARVSLFDAGIPFVGTCSISFRTGQLAVRLMPTERTLSRQFTTELLFRFCDLLIRLGPALVRRCPRCNRFFLGTTYQRFDRPTCRRTNRIRISGK